MSEILFVKHVENHLNVRITLKSTGERIREKRHSSKLCAKTKSLYRKNISMQFPNDQVSSLFVFTVFLTSFRCEICGYQCRQRASLNWHMKKHTPEAHYNYTCEFCHKRFEKLDSVKFHKVKSHPEKQTTWDDGMTWVSLEKDWWKIDHPKEELLGCVYLISWIWVNKHTNSFYRQMKGLHKAMPYTML